MHRRELIVAGAGGVPLHVEVVGEHGPLRLFLHGFPENGRAWAKQLAFFGANGRAAALDLRGYAPSGQPAAVEDYRLPRLVEDVGRVAAQLAPGQRITLVGHDWGGIIAWTVAQTHPEWLERLVIINSPHPAIFQRELQDNLRQRVASSYILLFRRRRLAERLLRWRRCALLRAGVFGTATAVGVFPAALRAHYLAAWQAPGGLTGGLNYYRANHQLVYGGDAVMNLRIRVPTLVLWGEQDQTLLTGNLSGLEHYVEPLQVVRVADATHWIVHEQPERVNEEIAAFEAATRGG